MATGDDYVGVQLLTSRDGIELGSAAGRPPREQQLTDTSPCFVAEPSPVLRRYERTRSAVRLLVRGIYLFPALLLVKLAFWLAAHAGVAILGTIGDYLTVAFVSLVVVFFFFLGLLVLQHLWVGPRSQRARHQIPRFALPEPSGLESSRLLVYKPTALELSGVADPSAGPGSKIRVRGELVAIDGGARGTPLLREAWLETAQGAARLIQARPFAVVAEGQLPVVVQIEAAPWLLLGAAAEAQSPIRVDDDRRGAFDARLAQHDASLRELCAGQARELCAGQLVELVGVVAERWPRVEEATIGGRPVRLGAGAGQAPYRGSGGGPAVLLQSSAYEPVLVVDRS